MSNSDEPGTHLTEEETENIYGIRIPEENHWFLKEATNRRLVDTMLTDKPNGHFYVRSRNDADSKEYPYALSLKWDNHVVHIKIQRTDKGRLVLAPWMKGEEVFETVDDLVTHYQDHVFEFMHDGKYGMMSLNRGRRY